MFTPAGLSDRLIEIERGSVAVWEGGAGAPVLLLHGFPQTKLMWRDIAPLLTRHFRVIAADLPGYGESSCPEFTTVESMSKREMAKTLVAMMRSIGHDQFAIAGHDRGGRVAYRAALDQPKIITDVAVLDVLPTYDVWEKADARLALAFWPFSLLAQPYPLPEQIMEAASRSIIENALTEWGTPRATFPDWVADVYVAALSRPAHIHAICQEYRAAASVDRQCDMADLELGRKIECQLLALWSETGGLANWYSDAGGPMGIWKRWASRAEGRPVKGGHFFPEEYPAQTADALTQFLIR